MKRFTNSGGVVCVDATHGTNMYAFYLITIMVLDDFGEGVPVAWCLSDKEDTFSLINFLKHLHDRVGNVSPNIFMSDDAEQHMQKLP